MALKNKSIRGYTPRTARRIRQNAGGVHNSAFENHRLPQRRAATGCKLVQTPGGGIAARSGTTVSSAECTEYKIVAGVLTTNTETIDVENIWPVAIPGNYPITAIREQITGKWIVQFPGVLNVRWVDPVLEQTLDGTNYPDIDTAEECAEP